MKKTIRKYIPLMLSAILLLSGCGKNSPSSGEEVTTGAVTQEATTQAEERESTERSFPVTEQYVKLTGRTQISNDIRWLIHSASKIEFKMKGTKASVVVRSDGSINGAQSGKARYAVYVNGERTMERMVTKMEETVEVFSSGQETEAEIAIVKLSEAANSIFGVKEIRVTGSSDIEPLPEKKMKIEFIGDSITCGYGVDDEVKEHHFSTETEDATKTYAVKAAAELDYDYSIVAYSGHGIISGYSGDGQQKITQLVPSVYELLGKNYGSAGKLVGLDDPWDFSKFVPDYVVINLGTNDASYIGNDPEKKEAYIKGYTDFLKMIRKDNPSARIIASLGIMGDGLFPAVEEAVKRYTEETGDAKVSTLHFRPQDGSTGYAADWHPTEATQQLAARELVEHITALNKDPG